MVGAERRAQAHRTKVFFSYRVADTRPPLPPYEPPGAWCVRHPLAGLVHTRAVAGLTPVARARRVGVGDGSGEIKRLLRPHFSPQLRPVVAKVGASDC